MKITILTVLLCGSWTKGDIQTNSRNFTDLISACTYEYLEEINCQFYNDRSGLDYADWIKYYGKTPSEDTGPEGAIGGTYYIYIETSTMMKSGKNAYLISSFLASTDTQLCLSFYYHMFGDSIGELQVIISISGSNNIIFSKTHSQGNYWHYKELFFRPSNAFQIIFNGLDGSGNTGDIALDHILLFSGDCDNYTVSIDVPSVPIGASVNLEDGLTFSEIIAIILGIFGSGAFGTTVIACCKKSCESPQSLECETDHSKDILMENFEKQKSEITGILKKHFEKQKLEITGILRKNFEKQKSEITDSAEERKTKKFHRTSNKVANNP